MATQDVPSYMTYSQEKPREILLTEKNVYPVSEKETSKKEETITDDTEPDFDDEETDQLTVRNKQDKTVVFEGSL